MLKNAHGRLLFIRADGGPQIGYGHLMRSTAIAEEWLARGGRCAWATTAPRALDAAGSGRDDVKILTLDVEAGARDDALATRRLAEECDADWVLADLVAFSPDYFSSVGARRAGWMIVHDESLRVSERINAILNPGPQALPGLYPGHGPSCMLLLGPAFALLRSEIRARAVQREVVDGAPGRILLTFGGSDPADLTSRTLHALQEKMQSSRVRWRVILGPGYRGQCAAAGGDFGEMAVEFVRYTSDMGRHYAWADLIVCGTSTTLWESLYFGLPAIVMPVVKNQRLIYDELADCPAVRRFDAPGPELVDWLSRLLQNDPAESHWLTEAAATGPRMIDGNGVVRVVDRLLAWK